MKIGDVVRKVGDVNCFGRVVGMVDIEPDRGSDDPAVTWVWVIQERRKKDGPLTFRQDVLEVFL